MEAWAQILVDYPTHPKTTAAGVEAAWLDVAAICWSVKHATDGHIPQTSLKTIGAMCRNPRQSAARLVAVGRWEAAADGWHVHDFADYQMSADSIAESRRKARDRQRLARERARQLSLINGRREP